MASLKIYQKRSDKEDQEIEGLLAQAEAIFANPDEVLAKFDMVAV